jgi:hypothetical protein
MGNVTLAETLVAQLNEVTNLRFTYVIHPREAIYLGIVFFRGPQCAQTYVLDTRGRNDRIHHIGRLPLGYIYSISEQVFHGSRQRRKYVPYPVILYAGIFDE